MTRIVWSIICKFLAMPSLNIALRPFELNFQCINTLTYSFVHILQKWQAETHHFPP